MIGLWLWACTTTEPAAPSAGPGDPVARLVGVLDADGDGLLDRKETHLGPTWSEVVVDFDLDGDRKLDPTEVRRLLIAHPPLRAYLHPPGTTQGEERRLGRGEQVRWAVEQVNAERAQGTTDKR